MHSTYTRFLLTLIWATSFYFKLHAMENLPLVHLGNHLTHQLKKNPPLHTSEVENDLNIGYKEFTAHSPTHSCDYCETVIPVLMASPHGSLRYEKIIQQWLEESMLLRNFNNYGQVNTFCTFTKNSLLGQLVKKSEKAMWSKILDNFHVHALTLCALTQARKKSNKEERAQFLAQQKPIILGHAQKSAKKEWAQELDKRFALHVHQKFN